MNPSDKMEYAKTLEIYRYSLPNTHENILERAKNYIAEAQRIMGTSHDIKISFRSNMRTAFAKACSIKKEIYFSAELSPLRNEEELKQTAIHEACHIIADYLTGAFIDQKHGKIWKHVMIKCGQKPDRHGIPVEVPYNIFQHEVRCSCRKMYFSRTRYARLISGKRKYRCVLCKTHIRVANQ